MMEKHQLRKQLLAMRRAMTPQEKACRDQAIGERLLAWLEAHPAQCVGVYWPIQGEPDLRPVYPALIERGMRLALPVVLEREAPLPFHPWRPGDGLEPDMHGVMAPVERGEAARPDLLIVPCVGFNAEGYRLGYGGGYYDRTMGVDKPPRMVGIAYAMCDAAFAAGPHDAPMLAVVTEMFSRDYLPFNASCSILRR